MMPIEQKFVDLTMCPNLLHVIVVTNASWVVPATTDERRFFVLDVSDKMTGDKAYFKALAAQTETPNAALLWYLLHEVDLTGFDPRFVPATKALYDQMSHGLEDALRQRGSRCLCRGELHLASCNLNNTGIARVSDLSPHQWPVVTLLSGALQTGTASGPEYQRGEDRTAVQRQSEGQRKRSLVCKEGTSWWSSLLGNYILGRITPCLVKKQVPSGLGGHV